MRTWLTRSGVRWPPTNIAASPEQALSRLFMLPGARFSAPEFSWKFEAAPGGTGFVDGSGLGPQFEGDLFMGGARTFLEGGHLFHFNLTGNRDRSASTIRGSRIGSPTTTTSSTSPNTSLLIGRNFGIVTNIETGPNGNLFVVCLTQGAIHEISRR